MGRVGIIALVGFVLGVAWPRLAGVHLAPSAPADEGEGVAVADDSAAASGAPAPAASAPPAAKLAPAPAPESDAVAEPQDTQRVIVKESTITSCHDADGRKLKKCDQIDFNGVLGARIQALATCKAAQGTKGILSIGFDLDFKSGKVLQPSLGKSTTVPTDRARELLLCASKALQQASIAGIQHKAETYTVFYVAELLVPGAAGDAGAPGGDVSAASGHATVSWDAAIIRESPKDGKVIARILRGTRVVVTAKNGDWYRIKYDAKGNEGWVYRSAIGL